MSRVKRKTKTKKVEGEAIEKPARVLHPYIILLLAIFLPGVGQVMNNTPGRGLLMVFFMIALGMVTFQTTTPAHSIIGRFSGGLFIYAISILDAYRWGKYRWEYVKLHGQEKA